MVAQTRTSYAWARDLLKYRETGLSQFYARFALVRTIIGLILRILVVSLAPALTAALVGRQVRYDELIAYEPSLFSIVLIALMFGILRNISRLIMVYRLRH